MSKLTALKTEKAKLEARIKEEEERVALRYGRIFVKSGLADMGISDKDLFAELKAMASRFRKEEKPSGKAKSPALSTAAET